ncbi:MAG: Sec-independent protein translocase protein TatC [Anaerolineaceae bacterium 46_22]|nr:MAG: Sec-independent protein translocase protein TatC [Anaerolineaceae bacterium 46_22]
MDMSEQSREMTIWGHLNELRKRLFISVGALVVGVIISFIFGDQLLQWVARPIGGLENLLSIQVTENISVYFRVTMLAGFIIALPFILIQIMLFVSPGLSTKERKWVLWAIPIATLLFLGGAVFAYFVMLPTALPFLVEFPGPDVLPKWKDYVNFVTNLIFWIGLSFETPLVMYLLAKLGIIDAKGLAKQWRIAIIIIAVIAAVATPTPDPINMAILMAPLFGLYLLGILLAVLAKKEKKGE